MQESVLPNNKPVLNLPRKLTSFINPLRCVCLYTVDYVLYISILNNKNRHRITQNQKIMKTIRLLLLIMVTLSVTCIGCSKIDDENNEILQQKSTPASTVSDEDNLGINKTWIDNFDAPYSLPVNWTLYGTPEPKWVSTAYGKTGLFDNNGPSTTKNFAVSHKVVGSGYGYTVESEIILNILNPGGTCVCPGIGVSRELNPELKYGEIETGITMRIIYAGTNATWFPPASRGNTWLAMAYLAENDEIAYSYIKANNYSNNWHKMKIIVSPTRNIKFYCDNVLVWAPVTLLHQTMTADKNVVLGYTSAGDPATRAGTAYHNWVKASYMFGTINN